MTGLVRRAIPEDADALAACITMAYARYSDLTLPDVAGDVDQEIADHLVWVFESEGHIVGGVIVNRAGTKAHLRNIAVHPEYGGRGVGASLIKTAIDSLHGQGIRTVELTTHIGMPENVVLYRHLGWTETGREGNKVFMSRVI